MPRKKKKNYMSNAEFFEEIVACQEDGEISDKLGKMFMLLIRRYATKPKFSGYSYNEDMISNAILACVDAFDKFDPTKSQNPFAYFTMVTHNSFLQILNKEKKQQNIRDKKRIENNLDPSSGYLEKHYEGLAEGRERALNLDDESNDDLE